MDWVGELYRIIKQISYGGTSRKLTTQLIAALDETVSPSGGGGGLIQTATVTLTDAQIKALPSSSVIIIPPTGNLTIFGTLIKVISAVAFLDARAGAYDSGSVTEGDLVLAYDSNAAGPDLGRTVTMSVDLELASLSIIRDQTKQQQLNFLIADTDPLLNTSSLDNGIGLYMHNNAGNVTGGNPANTLKVIVYYTVVDVS